MQIPLRERNPVAAADPRPQGSREFLDAARVDPADLERDHRPQDRQGETRHATGGVLSSPFHRAVRPRLAPGHATVRPILLWARAPVKAVDTRGMADDFKGHARYRVVAFTEATDPDNRGQAVPAGAGGGPVPRGSCRLLSRSRQAAAGGGATPAARHPPGSWRVSPEQLGTDAVRNARQMAILVALGEIALIRKGQRGTAEEQFADLRVPIR